MLLNAVAYILNCYFNSSIFAGTESGVFWSVDNGDNWVEVNMGLTNTFVRSLIINSEGIIFAGTVGSGVFRGIETTF
ncbi:MAG: hypothetical protein IIB39_03685 [Candidatus Marinimicrobia bacterium]|nr:hypothetical protein [Candidatus Neomarinimicrobiota bacterium]